MTMTIAYLNCPRCGLSLRTHAGRSPGAECPRCFGQVGLRVPMYETARSRPPAPEPVRSVVAARGQE